MIPLSIDPATPKGVTLALLPEIVLTGWALVVMLLAAWRHRDAEDGRRAGQLALVGIVAAAAADFWLWSRGATAVGLPLMIALDPFRYAASAIFLLGAALTVLLSLGYLGRERIRTPEYYVLLLFATVGAMLMGGGADLIVIFLGLETLSVCVYVLAGIQRHSPFAAEAGLKYFLLGAFASGFLLYGIALVYGATGTTNLSVIDFQLTSTPMIATGPMFIIGTAMLLIGFGFKVAAVPFHMWTPDVYDGAPTPVTAFMAAAVKAAGFAAFLRVVVQGFGHAEVVWQHAVWWFAVLTMFGGNLVALAQRHLKRMLAYSSIGHAGYLLVAVASGSTMGGAAFLFYVLAYTLMTVGAFAVVAAAGRGGERELLIDDLAGLASRRPWIAFATAVFMLSLLGFPGTAGFIGKWYILSSAVAAGHGTLAVFLVAASVISAGYYLPVVMTMYMKPARDEAEGDSPVFDLPSGVRAVIGTAAVLTLLLGVWPNRAMDLARQGGESLRRESVTVSTVSPAPPPRTSVP